MEYMNLFEEKLKREKLEHPELFDDNLHDERFDAVAMACHKIYNVEQAMNTFCKLSITYIDYSSGEYTICFESGLEKDLSLVELRKYVTNIEDYNLPANYYVKDFKLEYVPNKELGTNFIKEINNMDLNEDSENIVIRTITLEGLSLQLLFTPGDMKYHYLLSKKVGKDNWESVGFIDYQPMIRNPYFREEMYTVMKEYAREHNLFFTREND